MLKSHILVKDICICIRMCYICICDPNSWTQGKKSKNTITELLYRCLLRHIQYNKIMLFTIYKYINQALFYTAGTISRKSKHLRMLNFLLICLLQNSVKHYNNLLKILLSWIFNKISRKFLQFIWRRSCTGNAFDILPHCTVYTSRKDICLKVCFSNQRILMNAKALSGFYHSPAIVNCFDISKLVRLSISIAQSLTNLTSVSL